MFTTLPLKLDVDGKKEKERKKKNKNGVRYISTPERVIFALDSFLNHIK